MSTYIPPIADGPLDEDEDEEDACEVSSTLDHCYANPKMDPLVENVITYVAGTHIQFLKIMSKIKLQLVSHASAFRFLTGSVLHYFQVGWSSSSSSAFNVANAGIWW